MKPKANTARTERGTVILTVEVHPEVKDDLAAFADAHNLSMAKAANQILAEKFGLNPATGRILP
jgi:hypothetical protein